MITTRSVPEVSVLRQLALRKAEERDQEWELDKLVRFAEDEAKLVRLVRRVFGLDQLVVVPIRHATRPFPAATVAVDGMAFTFGISGGLRMVRPCAYTSPACTGWWRSDSFYDLAGLGDILRALDETVMECDDCRESSLTDIATEPPLLDEEAIDALIGPAVIAGGAPESDETLPRPVHTSFYDYRQSVEIWRLDPTFAALLIAAARKADPINLAKLRREWPEIVAEAESRFIQPGGLLPGEVDRENSVVCLGNGMVVPIDAEAGHEQ